MQELLLPVAVVLAGVAVCLLALMIRRRGAAAAKRYESAKLWHLARLKDAPDLGTRGELRGTRDQLHQR